MMSSVPFRTKDPDSKGSITLRDEALHFSFEAGGFTDFSLAFDELKEIRFEKGFLAASIEVLPVAATALRHLPVRTGAIGVFGIRRRDREAARELVKEVSFALMDRHLEDMLDITDL